MLQASLLLISLLVSAVSAYCVMTGAPSGAWPYQAFWALMIWGITYFWTTTLHYRSPYLLTTAYIGPLAVFHLTWIVFYVLGDMSSVRIALSETSLSYYLATWYSVLAFGSLGTGAALRMCIQRKSFQKSDLADFRIKQSTQDWVFKMGMGLFVASLIFFGMFIAAAGNPLQYSRAQFFETAVAGRGLGAFLMVFPGAVVALVVGARTRKAKVFAWSVAAFAFLVILLSGYRSQAMYPLLVLVTLLSKTGRRIPFPIAVAGLIFILISIPVIQQVRELTYEKINVEKVTRSAENASVADGLATLGSTLGVFARAIEVVPSRASFQLGYTYWVAIRDALPNISWTMSESARSSALGNFIKGSRAIFDLPPGDWMTYIIDPQKFRIGHGVGFSAVAEPYVNFGVLGVIVFFFVLGFCLAWLDGIDMWRHPWVLLITAATLWALLRTVRNSIGNFTKPLVFSLVIIGIWWVLLKVIGRGSLAPEKSINLRRPIISRTLPDRAQ